MCAACAAESEDKKTMNMKKFEKKMKKIQALENGVRQFHMIPQPANRAYVWVSNVSIPIGLTR